MGVTIVPVANTNACAAEVEGRPCKSPRLKGDVHCYFHSKSMVEKRKMSQRRGAKSAKLTRKFCLASELPESMRTVDQLMVTVEAIIREVVTERMEPRRATALSGLIKLMADLVLGHEIEERVRVLEENVA